MVLDLASFLSETDVYQPPPAVVTTKSRTTATGVTPNNNVQLIFDAQCMPAHSPDPDEFPFVVLKADDDSQHLTQISQTAGDANVGDQRCPDFVTVWPINVEQNTVPVANGLLNEFQLGIHNPTNTFYTVAINFRQPYMWNSNDLAEIVWSFLLHYTGALTDDDRAERRALLNFNPMNRYSVKVALPHARQQYTIIRKIGTKLVDQLFSLIDQSFAMVTWDGYGAGLESKFGLVAHTEVQDNIDVYDLNIGEEDFITSKLTFANNNEEFVLNAMQIKYGSGVNMRGGNYPTKSDNIDLFSPQGQDNLVQVNDEESQDTYGVRQGVLQQEDITDQISLDGDYNMAMFGKTTPEIEFSQGLKAFDYSTGDFIHVVNDQVGLNGTEDILVLEKTIDFDTMITVTRGVVRSFDPAAFVMSPNDFDTDLVTLPELQYWYKGTTGITSGGDGTAVTAWADQSVNGNDAGPRGGASTAPLHAVNQLNSQDVVDFNVNTAALAIVPIDVFDEDTQITLIALVQPHGSVGAVKRALWGSFFAGAERVDFQLRSAATDGMGWLDSIADRHSDVAVSTEWQIVVMTAWRDKVYSWPQNFAPADSWGTEGACLSHCRQIRLSGTGAPETLSYLGPREGALTGTSDLVYTGAERISASNATLGNEGNVPYDSSFQGYMAEFQLWAHRRNARQFSNQELNGLTNDIRNRWGF